MPGAGMSVPMRFLPCGDAAVLVELDDLPAVVRLSTAVREGRPLGDAVLDVVPAARTVLLRCRPGTDLRALVGELVALDLGTPTRAVTARQEVRLPVVYDGEDLDEVAGLTGLSVEEVVGRHQATVWEVAFTGFAPGFGYLVATGDGAGSLDVPRRREPRTRVPAGSVGLAGEFTGVYPRESPGGWQLIGRTDATLWDPAREPPALLTPGTRVRFDRAPGRS